MRLQSAIFDMDGTLLDTMFIWDDLGPGMLRDIGITPEEDLSEKLKVLTLRQGAAYCKERYALPQSVEEIVSLIEGRVDLLRRVHGLPEPYREVVYLRSFGGLSFREIGDVLDKTETWARVTFYRGKERLKIGGDHDEK